MTISIWDNVEWIRSDGGGEYFAAAFKEWPKDRGTLPELTASYSPKSSGKAERLNGTLLNMARTTIHGIVADFRLLLYAEEKNAINYTLKRLLPKSPHEKKTFFGILFYNLNLFSREIKHLKAECVPIFLKKSKLESWVTGQRKDCCLVLDQNLTIVYSSLTKFSLKCLTMLQLAS